MIPVEKPPKLHPAAAAAAADDDDAAAAAVSPLAALAGGSTPVGSPAASQSLAPVILYDGVCGLCDRFVLFVLRHDRRKRFRFAPLQGTFAGRALSRLEQQLGGPQAGARAGEDGGSVVLIEEPETNQERARIRSDAVLTILTGLGGRWRVAALLFRVVPRPLRDLCYAVVARFRYRIFGRLDRCALPSVSAGRNPSTDVRFLD